MKLRMPTQSIDTPSGAQIPSTAIGATTSVLVHHPSPSGHVQNLKPPSNTIIGLLSIWQIVSVAVVGGALFGFGIAMPPIYDTLTKDILDCARYSSSASSCPVSTGYCVLVNNDCTFPHKDLCRVSNTGQSLTYAQCMAVDAGLGGLVSSSSDATSATMPYRYYSSCQWVSNICTATNEIPSGRLGTIASMLTVGGLVGSSAGSYFLSMFGYRHVVFASGVLTLLSALITHANPFGFYTMVAMRFVFGLSTGVVCVAAPTYVDIHTPQSLRDVAGCVFQISITLGIAITAILGYILSDTDGVVKDASLQGFLALCTIFSGLLVAVAAFCMKADVAQPNVTSYDINTTTTTTTQPPTFIVEGLAPLNQVAIPTPTAIISSSPLSYHDIHQLSKNNNNAVNNNPSTIDLDALVVDDGEVDVRTRPQFPAQNNINNNMMMGVGGNGIGGSPITGGGYFNSNGSPTTGPTQHQDQQPFVRATFGSTPMPPILFGLSPAPPVDTLGHVVILEPNMVSPPAPLGAQPNPTFLSFDNPLVKQAFVTVTVLILVMQFTGINAIMNYAPRIAKSMGVPPMLGNAVIMSWNFVTTLAAVPLASKLPLRKLYLLGLIAASVGCGISSLGSCLTGSHGGVTALTSFISCIGIALFIAGFETGMAPAGFVLVQRAYPSHLTGEAMGYYNAGQFFFGILITGLFPVLSDYLISILYNSTASSTADTAALEVATAYTSCVLFAVFSIVGVVGWYVLKKRLP